MSCGGTIGWGTVALSSTTEAMSLGTSEVTLETVGFGASEATLETGCESLNSIAQAMSCLTAEAIALSATEIFFRDMS